MFTTIERVVAPVDHKYPFQTVEVSVTVWPGLRIVGPLAVTTGTGGGVQPFAMTATGADVAVQPFVPVILTR